LWAGENTSAGCAAFPHNAEFTIVPINANQRRHMGNRDRDPLAAPRRARDRRFAAHHQKADGFPERQSPGGACCRLTTAPRTGGRFDNRPSSADARPQPPAPSIRALVAMVLHAWNQRHFDLEGKHDCRARRIRTVSAHRRGCWGQATSRLIVSEARRTKNSAIPPSTMRSSWTALEDRSAPLSMTSRRPSTA
jgi:hypothetical protein